jgi:hypothetical protein
MNGFWSWTRVLGFSAGTWAKAGLAMASSAKMEMVFMQRPSSEAGPLDPILPSGPLQSRLKFKLYQCPKRGCNCFKPLKQKGLKRDTQPQIVAV